MKRSTKKFITSSATIFALFTVLSPLTVFADTSTTSQTGGATISLAQNSTIQPVSKSLFDYAYSYTTTVSKVVKNNQRIGYVKQFSILHKVSSYTIGASKEYSLTISLGGEDGTVEVGTSYTSSYSETLNADYSKPSRVAMYGTTTTTKTKTESYYGGRLVSTTYNTSTTASKEYPVVVYN
ncbi:MAG: hypothetical protein LBI43_03180 [Streptococcaceae bacterium]|jgi:hypothetical protein|nr:hypothetical protein [Streptococcaceae bacterium]